MRAYIVEGSEIIRSRLALLLAEIEGVELVGQAGSAEIAKENILRLQPDVVLIDVKLPDGNGLDLLEAIQARVLGIRAIVMTYNPYQQYRKRAMELGADCFVDKATGLESIRLTMERMAAEQRVTLKAA